MKQRLTNQIQAWIPKSLKLPRLASSFSALEVKVFRFTLAIGIAIILAYLVSWPLSFICPVLLASLMQSHLPQASSKEKIQYILIIILLVLFGQALSALTSATLAGAITIGLLIFYAQYKAISGADPFLIVVFIISILLLPLVSMDSSVLALILMRGLITSSLVAILCMWLVYELIPESNAEKKVTPPAPKLPKHDRVYIAALKTLLILPAYLIIFSFQLSSHALVLIFIVILMQMPSTEMGIKGSIGILLGNVLGAIAAVIAYNALVIMPTPLMIVLLPVLTTLIFSVLIFKPHKLAPVFSTALTTSFSIIGLTTMAYGDEAGDKSTLRIAQIAMAGSYAVIMLALAEPFIKKRLPGV